MQRIGAPLPFQPGGARPLGVEIVLDLEAHAPREPLRVLPDDQVVIGVVHHLLRHERRRAHALDARHRAGALARAVHARGVELHDAFGVRQAAVADARVLGIELDDVDAGDERVEDVLAPGHQREGASPRRSSCRRSCSVWPLAEEMTTGRTLPLRTGGRRASVPARPPQRSPRRPVSMNSRRLMTHRLRQRRSDFIDGHQMPRLRSLIVPSQTDPVATRQISLETIREAAATVYEAAIRTPLVRLDATGPFCRLKAEATETCISSSKRCSRSARSRSAAPTTPSATSRRRSWPAASGR